MLAKDILRSSRHALCERSMRRSRGSRNRRALFHNVAEDERIKTDLSLSLLLSSSFVDIDQVLLFTTWHVATVYPAAEGGIARNSEFSESGGVQEDSLFTDFDKEVGKLGTERAALRNSFAKIYAWLGFEEGVVYQRIQRPTKKKTANGAGKCKIQ